MSHCFLVSGERQQFRSNNQTKRYFRIPPATGDSGGGRNLPVQIQEAYSHKVSTVRRDGKRFTSVSEVPRPPCVSVTAETKSLGSDALMGFSRVPTTCPNHVSNHRTSQKHRVRMREAIAIVSRKSDCVLKPRVSARIFW